MQNLSQKKSGADEQIVKIARAVDEFEGYPFPHAMRVADTYATLTEARPYRQPFSAAEARRNLTERSGIEYDPTVVKMILSLEGSEELDSYHESTKI